MPVTPEEQASPHYQPGIQCPACHDRRDARQRAGYAERQRQVALAAERGVAHLGSLPGTGFDETPCDETGML
jgi:UPF0176 protein